MSISATLYIPGPISVLGATAEVPVEGVAFRNDGIAERTLYIDGVEVGHLVAWPNLEFESLWLWGCLEPPEHIVTKTELQCVLNWPPPA